MADRPPDDPELLLENVASLDTARMTLRWALERIRGLERTHAETQELLQRSFESRQAAEDALADFKKSFEERGRKLAEKERFVGDMQKILNDLFKGDVDVSEFVKRRQALDEERATLESRVRRRLEEAEAAQRREVEENAKRLADMEGVYSASLAEAQRRFHAEVERLERDQAAALKAERERFDQFRSESHVEGARAADEYQRRILIFEHEYAAKRREMAEDLDRLKARLGEEVRASVAAAQAEGARAAARWDAERAQIEARLAERETRLGTLEGSLKQAEAAYFAREEAVFAAHAKELEALRARWAEDAVSRQKVFDEANAELARRDAAFQQERLAWVVERNQLREHIAAEYEPVIEALRERLAGAAREAEAERGRLLDEQSALRRQDVEKFAADLRALESAHHERDLAARREGDADLEALRRHFDEALARQRAESRKEVESHAAEVLALRARLRQQQDELTAALEASERRRGEDIRASEAALALRHEDDLARLRRDRDEAVARLAREHEDALVAANARLAEAQARAAAEREALVKEAEAARNAEAARSLAALREADEAAHRREAHLTRQNAEALAQAEAAARRAAEAHEAEARGLRAAATEASKAAAEDRVSLSSAYEEALRREASARRTDLDALAAKAAADLRESEARRVAETTKLAEERSSMATAYEEALRREAAARRDEVAAVAAKSEAALRAAAAERLEELERLRRELDTPSSKSPAEQIEEMTRQCRRALEALEAGRPASPAGSPIVVHAAPRRWPWFAAAGLIAAAAAARFFLPGAAPAPQKAPAAAVKPSPTAPALPAAAEGELPFKNVTGLAWQGDRLWATDWREQALYLLDGRGGALAVEARVPLPGTHPTGLAVNGAEFYVTDSWSRQIQRWRLAGGEALLTASWPSPGPQPSALYYDGNSLWSADSSEKRVYRHALDPELTVLSTYEVDFPVVGLWADAERFWSADTANRLVHRHRFDDVLSLVASYGLPQLDDGRTQLSAFAMKDGKVWLGRDGDPRLLSRPLTDFQERHFAPRGAP